jgi:threonine dehydratase
VVEGSGAVGVAALLHDHWSDPDCKVGVVLTGGNLDEELLHQITAVSPSKGAFE